MKIVITESQLKRMMGEAAPLSKDELEKRLVKAKKLAVKFKNTRQFALAHPQLWNTIRAFDKLDDVFPERKKYKPDGYWDAVTVADESRKYKGRSEFQRGNQIAYKKAVELGILDDLFPVKQIIREPYYNLEKSIELAKDFEGGRKEFFDEYPSAYRMLKSNNLLTMYFGEVVAYNKVSDDILLDKAKQYSTVTDLVKNDKQLYINLKNRSLIEKLYPYPLRIQKLLDIAKKFENKFELKTNYSRGYNKLKELGLLDVAYPKLSLSNLAVDDEPKEN